MPYKSSSALSEKGSGQISNNIIKYRYLIAIIIFIILVIFKVNGSSIGSWSPYVGDSAKSSIVAGIARPIRSDEWEVLTPNVMAQGKSETPYSLINPNIGASGENMLVSLGMPVKDIYEIAQPLNWGYLLLGSEYGLAWYWNMKMLLIFMLSFELCLIITKNNRGISVLGAFWLTFSPAVQWWFAQHVGNVLLYMEAIIITFYYFFKYFDKIWAKIAFAFLFALACVGYVFPLYPPLQVTFGYLALVIMVIILVDFRKKVKIKKSDMFIIGGTGLFIILMLVHAFLITKGALLALSHTAYPGKRVSLGGDAQNYSIYSFLTNLFLPYKDVNILNSNNCEISTFFNFLPAVILALPFLIRKRIANLKFGIALALFSGICLYFMYFQIPLFLAKLTLLSYVPGSRAMLAYGLAATLASIWALAEISKLRGFKRFFSFAVSILVGITYYITVKYTAINGYVHLRYYVAFILILIVLNYLLLRGNKRLFTAIMLGVVLLAGATVNPINIGVGAIYNNDLSREIQAIDKQDPNAVWFSVSKNDAGAMGALIYANGAKSLSGINSIPEVEIWHAIDPAGKYKSIYNRDAHITFAVVNDPTNFALLAAGYFSVNINVNDLKKVNARYIVSDQNLVTFNNSQVTFTQVYPTTPQGYTIYRVSYK